MNLAAKREMRTFLDDVPLLLPPGTDFDVAAGVERVANELVALLPGQPWRGPTKQPRSS